METLRKIMKRPFSFVIGLLSFSALLQFKRNMFQKPNEKIVEEPSKNALPHMNERKFHPKKCFDQIEVFGSMVERSWIQGPKATKEVFINVPRWPVRNPSDRFNGDVRGKGIEIFDNLVWQIWDEMEILQKQLQSGLMQD